MIEICPDTMESCKQFSSCPCTQLALSGGKQERQYDLRSLFPAFVLTLPHSGPLACQVYPQICNNITTATFCAASEGGSLAFTGPLFFDWVPREAGRHGYQSRQGMAESMINELIFLLSDTLHHCAKRCAGHYLGEKQKMRPCQWMLLCCSLWDLIMATS